MVLVPATSTVDASVTAIWHAVGLGYLTPILHHILTHHTHTHRTSAVVVTCVVVNEVGGEV